MQLYAKEGILFLVQLDHLSGELVGDVIEDFYQAGAKNVQVISTITKKNRLGCLILIDGKENTADAIERVIVESCGSSGWHRIESCHRHTEVRQIAYPVTVEAGGQSFCFTAKGKQIAGDKEEIRPEYDSCIELRKELALRGIRVSTRKVQCLLFRAMTEGNGTVRLSLGKNK